MISLQDFQNSLDARVLERGQAYFMEGAVLDLIQETPNEWTALVAGSSEYNVTVVLESNRIAESQCDCPYDQGLHCKHEVAVWLAIREDLKREAFAKETGQPQKLSRKPSFQKQVEQVGAKVDKSDLLDFIVSEGKNDRAFREAFLIRFGQHLGEDKAAVWRRTVQHIIRQAAGGKGYLDVRDTEAVADELSALLDRHEEDAQFATLKSIVQEEVREAMKSAEDFEGYLAGLA